MASMPSRAEDAAIEPHPRGTGGGNALVASEVMVFVHVPVQGTMKKIEFGYDARSDSPELLAQEITSEFTLSPEYTEKIRNEIAEQVMRSAPPQGDVSAPRATSPLVSPSASSAAAHHHQQQQYMQQQQLQQQEQRFQPPHGMERTYSQAAQANLSGATQTQVHAHPNTHVNLAHVQYPSDRERHDQSASIKAAFAMGMGGAHHFPRVPGDVIHVSDAHVAGSASGIPTPRGSQRSSPPSSGIFASGMVAEMHHQQQQLQRMNKATASGSGNYAGGSPTSEPSSLPSIVVVDSAVPTASRMPSSQRASFIIANAQAKAQDAAATAPAGAPVALSGPGSAAGSAVGTGGTNTPSGNAAPPSITVMPSGALHHSLLPSQTGGTHNQTGGNDLSDMKRAGSNESGVLTQGASSSGGTGSVKATPRSGPSMNAPQHNAKYFAACMSLMEHASKGNIKGVRLRLGQGASAGYADYDKRTPLHLAATEGHVEIAKMLIEHGADVEAVDRWGSTPMRDAMKNNHQAVVDVLEDAGAEREMTDEEVMGLELLEFSARGLVDLVRERLMAGVSAQYADYDMRTPLHLAASEGRDVIAELLLVNGAKMDAKDRFGRTPIDDALNNGHRDVLRVFRAYGATIPESAIEVFSREVYDLGMRLIDECANGDVDRVHALLEAGAPVNFGDYDFRTPLHLAAAEGFDEIAALLLNAGAQPDVRDRWKATPIDEAFRRGNTKLAELLQSSKQQRTNNADPSPTMTGLSANSQAAAVSSAVPPATSSGVPTSAPPASASAADLTANANSTNLG
ncbi:Ankyrin repeat domain-containing protein 50 [Porphyridium purpureum]|uniref:Ankyrin repeat domain-containing protein 50 n=1 Tax=Porphyridium purpureum TaxID=35688 RepID=A0A5J4YPZ6_PORPP|nr:Ankyrin repeat domain-containing protein 50 [Porphyridium purpureum]|eukprot:POR3938..scf296_7